MKYPIILMFIVLWVFFILGVASDKPIKQKCWWNNWIYISCDKPQTKSDCYMMDLSLEEIEWCISDMSQKEDAEKNILTP